MITIQYDRRALSVRISGHAGSGEYGRDLVCAAVSALAATLAQNVEDMAASGKLGRYSVSLNSGNGDIRCEPKPGSRREAVVLFEAICTGFDAIAKQYPENVSFERSCR